MALRVAELVRGTLPAIPAVGTYLRRTKFATFACWQKNRRAKIKAYERSTERGSCRSTPRDHVRSF